MPFTIAATVRTDYPGAVQLSVTGDPDVQSSIVRIDGTAAAQPVRNYSTTGASGLDIVTDMEAPLGRPIRYNLIDYTGALLAQTGVVTCPPLPSRRGILRSVLKPKVQWMEVEPQDETGVEWGSSTSVHRVVGKDTPVIIGEIRQRHSGVMSFLCRSIAEADQMVQLLRDGTPMLLRHDPCAQPQTRDLLFYALDVQETRYGRLGWRLVLVDYQSTAFVPGETEEPADEWTFEAMRDSAATFAELTSHYRTFADMAFDIRKTTTGPLPATGLRVTSRTQTTITLGWTNPSGSLGVPVVRRAAGTVPPATPTSGTAVAVSAKGATSAVDTGLTLSTAYAYSVWTTDPTGVELAATPSTLATSTVGYGVPTGTALTLLTTANNPYPAVATFPSTHVYQIAGDAVFVNWRFERRVIVTSGTVEFVNCYFAGSPTETTIANAALLMANAPTGTATVKATNCTLGLASPINGIDGLRGDRLTIDSCDIFGTVDGMQLFGVGQTTIKDSWIHGLVLYPTGGPSGGATHNDCAQISSGSSYQFLRNKCDGTINSIGVLITQNLGTTSNLLIEGNVFNLTGNGADVGVKDYDHPTSPRAVTGLVVRNNYFKNDLGKYQIHPSTLTFDDPTFVSTPNAWIDGSAPPARGWAVEDVWP